ncbi:MAG: OsmC family protein [Candidatus Zixiibacteriota bacterium]
MVTARMSWTGGKRFEGKSVFGHTIVTDTAKESGGQESGYKPTELLLYAIAGCTGVDVVGILQKQRQELTALEIEVVGHQPDTYPKPYHTVEIKYRARGKNLDSQKVTQAVELSMEKYCSVSQTVKCETKVTTAVEVILE